MSHLFSAIRTSKSLPLEPMTVVKMTVLKSYQLFKYVHSLCTSASQSGVHLVPSSLISRVILIVWEKGTWVLQKEQDSLVLSPNGGLAVEPQWYPKSSVWGCLCCKLSALLLQPQAVQSRPTVRWSSLQVKERSDHCTVGG